jgi:hypothetical protein
MIIPFKTFIVWVYKAKKRKNTKPKPLYLPLLIYTYMENESTQTTDEPGNEKRVSVKTRIVRKQPSTKVPLIITMIGIFCYLGVILPSVFESQAELAEYSTFDILLLVGGAALVGLGSYFWFKVKNKYSSDEEAKNVEPA